MHLRHSEGYETMKKIFFIVLIIVAASVIGALYFSREAIVEKVSQPVVEEEKKVWQEKTQQLEKEITALKEEIQKTEPSVPQEKLSEAFGKLPQVAPQQKEDSCKELNARALKFFNYLDQKGYLKGLAITGSAHEHFIKVAGLLETSRPVISGETQDLYVLMRNIAHFYRVLGEKDIKLIIAIVSGEAEIMEPTLKLFFEWINPREQCTEKDTIRLSPEALYDYASFFINTIAGHSYLARRELRVRTLALYYGVLILDTANEQGLNKYGIDIRPHIASVMDDIEGQKGLLYRKDYINKLNDIKRKYERPGISG